MTLIRKANAAPSTTLTRYLSLPLLRAIYGFILSFGSPLGWMLLQYLAGRDPFSETHFDMLLYAYITLATSVVFSLLGYFIGKRELMITDMALTDGLTGLYNKRYYVNRLDQEFERFLRHGSPVSLIQIDLDFFKNINDNFGHQVGDEILKRVAQIIRENCRKNEIAARVGGEELSVIAFDSDKIAAEKLAERIREKINGLKYYQLDTPIPVSASFGVAGADASMKTATELYEQADKALYEAKRTGRDKVCVYGESEPVPPENKLESLASPA